MLCGFGLYAVVALTPQLRRREYAIRLALGAPLTGVRWMVVRQAMLLAAGGTIVGVAARSTRRPRRSGRGAEGGLKGLNGRASG